jgi:hypothetical protein
MMMIGLKTLKWNLFSPALSFINLQGPEVTVVLLTQKSHDVI